MNQDLHLRTRIKNQDEEPSQRTKVKNHGGTGRAEAKLVEGSRQGWSWKKITSGSGDESK